MRLVSFFVLSLSLHAAALGYPVSFGERTHADLIQVKVFSPEQEGDGSGGQRGSAVPPPRGNSRARGTPPAVERKFEPKSPTRPEPEGFPPKAVAPVSDGSVASISATPNYTEIVYGTVTGPAGDDGNKPGIGLGRLGSGNGFGPSGSGFGQGSTSGNGSGSSGTATALTEASYRHTPRPVYPESARHEGREGRVLLRVLVDDQGKTKQVEINQSSGSDALDRAATEAIKRWRFHPARYGDQPVESWLRIPIEFRLADAKS